MSRLLRQIGERRGLFPSQSPSPSEEFRCAGDFCRVEIRRCWNAESERLSDFEEVVP